MLPIPMWIFSKSLFAIFFLFVGCVSFDNPVVRAQKELEVRTHQRIYFSAYESVWRATQLSIKYPIAVNNMDEGVIETEWIDAFDGFSPIHSKPRHLAYKYQLRLLLVKGRTEGRSSVRVTIIKTTQTPDSFFQDGRKIESDGLEETLLFYRIAREITVDQAIKAEARRANR
jgi:hypothetical protein